MNTRKIIISRTDNIGDVILTLPLAGYLKSKLKGIKIIFIGKDYTKAIIDCCEHVDIFMDREKIIRNPKLLSEQKAEVIIFVFPDKAVAKLSYQIKIPLRIGTSHRLIHWLYANRRVNFSRKKSLLHEAQLNFKLLRPLEFSNVPLLKTLPDYYGFKIKKKSIFKDFFNVQKFNLIIHPKSKKSAREWGLKNYLSLVRLLPKDKFDIYITGSKEEGKEIKRLAPEIFTFTHVKNITGKFDLAEFIELIDQSDGMVASSTGPLHIASALGKFVWGLYPSMRPIHPGRWAPIGKKANYLWKDIYCNKCKKSIICKCIQEITPEKVLNYIVSQYKD